LGEREDAPGGLWKEIKHLRLGWWSYQNDDPSYSPLS